MRAVNKVYQSKLVKRLPSLKTLTELNDKINLDHQVPLVPELQATHQKLFQVSNPPSHYLTYHAAPARLQWQMENALESQVSHWPADIIDLNFFLERAQFQMNDLHCPQKFSNIGKLLQSVGQDVGLSEKLQDFHNAAYIPEPKQVHITRQIIANYDALPDALPRDREQEACSNEQTYISVPSLSSRASFGSLSMDHSKASFGSVMMIYLLLVGYLFFKIYEFLKKKKILCYIM